MEQRLSVVTLGVADLERSRRFYEDGLGWRRGNASDEIVFFQIGGAVLALYPRHLRLFRRSRRPRLGGRVQPWLAPRRQGPGHPAVGGDDSVAIVLELVVDFGTTTAPQRRLPRSCARPRPDVIDQWRGSGRGGRCRRHGPGIVRCRVAS